MRRKAIWKFVAGLLFAGAIALLVFQRPLRIAYHRWALEHVTKKFYEAATPGPGNLVEYGTHELFEWQEFHRRNLTELGNYFHHTFVFDQLPPTRETQRALFKILTHPIGKVEPYFMSGDPEFASKSGGKAESVAFEVWDLTTRKGEWDRFHRTRNVPDFLERFNTGRAKVKSSLFSRMFIGNWMAEEGLALKIVAHGDELEIITPSNGIWKKTTHDAELSGGCLKFLQMQELNSGKDHPLHGSWCHLELQWIGPETLRMTRTSPRNTEVEVSQLRWCPVPGSSERFASGRAWLPTSVLTRNFLGAWGVDGEETLRIELDGDRVVFAVKDNPVWRIETHDASLSGDTVRFTQVHFLRDGESHPFNGEPCAVTLEVVDPLTLRMRLTTSLTPNTPPTLLHRMPEKRIETHDPPG